MKPSVYLSYLTSLCLWTTVIFDGNHQRVVAFAAAALSLAIAQIICLAHRQ